MRAVAKGERRSRRCGRSVGFTLTELLVVIAIIMGLAMTAVPAIQAFRRGQRLDHSAKIVQSAISDARRMAVTRRARHVAVLYSFEERGASEGTIERIRHAIRIYCEPIGDASWRNDPQLKSQYFPGGYVGKALILPPGIRFAQERMKFAQVFGPVPNSAEPLSLDSDYFKKSPQSKAIGFRRDGTFDYDPTVDEPAVNPAVGRNIYLPDERFYQVPDSTKADIVLIEVDPGGNEIRSKGKARRALIDLDPRTGRATAKTFEIGQNFDTE